MPDEKLTSSPNDVPTRSAPTQSIERVDPSEIDTVAQVLATVYAEYPLHAWAMPNAGTRLEDSKVFFSFYLRWMQRHSWDVFATADRLAVVVTRPVRYGNNEGADSRRYVPSLIKTKSPVNEFFLWVETFRPKVDHQFFEFLGCLPNAPRGTGFFLYASVLKMFDRQGIPVWTWTSNPQILPFFRRQGFEIGVEHRRDENSPPVIPLWRPSAPDKNDEESP